MRCGVSAQRSRDAGNIVMRSRLSQAKRSWTSAGGGREECPSFLFAESLFPHLSGNPFPLFLSPHSHTFQMLPCPPRRRTRVRASSVVLSETLRIVSKLTHTTNVREPCHTALGSASCCLRGRRCCRRSRAGAPGSARRRGRGGAGAGSAPLARRPRPSLPPPRTAK